MSYSFSVTAPTKAQVKAAVAEYFDKNVVACQPVHKRDRAAVLANADAVVDLLSDDDSKDIRVSVNGYVSWSTAGDQADVPLHTASITASAGFTDRA